MYLFFVALSISVVVGFLSIILPKKEFLRGARNMTQLLQQCACKEGEIPMTGLELRQRSSRYMPIGVQKDVYIDPMRTFCVEEKKQARCDEDTIEYEDSSGNIHCKSCGNGSVVSTDPDGNKVCVFLNDSSDDGQEYYCCDNGCDSSNSYYSEEHKSEVCKSRPQVLNTTNPSNVLEYCCGYGDSSIGYQYYSEKFQRGACCNGVVETIEIKERGGYMACCGGSGPHHGYYFYDYDSHHGLCCDGTEIVIPYSQNSNFACCGGLGEFYGYEHSISGSYGCCEETYGSGAYVETVAVPADDTTGAPSDICCGSDTNLWGYQYFLDGYQCCEGSKEKVSEKDVCCGGSGDHRGYKYVVNGKGACCDSIKEDTFTESECCDASGQKDSGAEFDYVENYEKSCCSGITGDQLDEVIANDKYVCCGATKEQGECCAGSVFKYDPEEATEVRCGRNTKEIKDSSLNTFTCVPA